jgi:zinc carboxypeptidase
MNVKVITGFDGSCPHYADGVSQDSEKSFTVYPGYRQKKGFSEESRENGGSRFYIRLENNNDNIQEVEIIADWDIDKRINHHDQGYFRVLKGEWRMVVGARVDKTKIKYTIQLPPGISELALFPEYNYAECNDFISSLNTTECGVEVVGVSQDGRDIWMLSLVSPNPKAMDFFIQARDHAYESAGSYCVVGIVRFLLEGSSMAKYLRSKFNFFIVPMTNPDGVYRGMSRLTWEQGADMNRVCCNIPDKAHETLQKTLDRIQPKVHMNIHNWTDKFTDGLLANESEIADKILHHFPADRLNHKRWRVQTHQDYLRENNLTECPENSKSWKNYCKENFDAYGVTFEFPWFSILSGQMEEKGEKALVAFALAVIEEINL